MAPFDTTLLEGPILTRALLMGDPSLMENIDHPLSRGAYLDEERQSAFLIDIPAHYRGPLDTLLHLIQGHKLDIYNIPISFILERYLEEVEHIKRLNLHNVGEHLEMVATLMELKSKLLLPQDPTEEEPEDPRAELVGQLINLQQQQAMSELLATQAAARRLMWSRESLDLPEDGPIDEEAVFHAGLGDLLAACERLILRRQQIASARFEISLDTIPLQDRMGEILEVFRHFDAVTFSELIRNANSHETVVSLMAVLELARTQVVSIDQEDTFTDIHLTRRVTDEDPPAEDTDHE